MDKKYLHQSESISRFCNFTSKTQRVLPPIQGFETLPLVSLEEAVGSLTSLVPQVNQMIWTVEQNYNESKAGLSKDETMAIMLYTLEWAPSENSFYFILNATLRSQNRRQLLSWFLYLRLLTFSLSKLPPSTHQILYRGVQMDLSNEYSEGKEFVWWSFTSCTSSIDVLENYIGKTGTRTIFNIICHSAKDISQHSCYQEEQEVLCYPARQFEVKSCFHAGNQLHIIQLEETQPKFPFFHIPQTSKEFKSSNKRKTSSLNNALQRTAIDSSGDLGSLYDVNRDCILGRMNVNDDQRLSQSYKTIRCEVIHGITEKNQNLLKMIGIQEELRLSILLNLAPRIGIASLIDYSHPVDNHTRCLHYSYLDREEQIPGEAAEIQKSIKLPLSKTDATHIITDISWGIEFIVILQLPSNDGIARKIDNAIENIQAILKGDRNLSSLTPEDENLLEKIITTKIYSNISSLMEMNSLLDICRCRTVIKNKSYIHHPLIYTLQPIQGLFPQYTKPEVTFSILSSRLNIKVEKYLLQLLNKLNSLNYNVTRLLHGHLREQLHEAQIQWWNLKDMYKDEIKRFENLIVNIRINRDDISEIDRALNDNNQTILKAGIKNLTQRVHNLEAKGSFINDLQQQQFQYYNVAERNVGRDDNEQTLRHKLIIDNQRDRILCSNDRLNTNNQSQLSKLRHQLIQEHQNSPNLHLIYADFSYCSFELHDMIILPSRKNTNTHSQTPTSPEDFINILLLGETSVGKSTFINAFVNYHKFEIFEQAESNEPIVLITTGQNLEEHTIKIADFNHLGQSVTQHCKSYVFHCKQNNGKKLRFIDTPGYGDRRGIHQDDFNMQNILEYIKNLSHLNAICLLFKSNTTQLNMFFRQCLTQVFDYLGPNARKNIIFCFTNTRSTAFTPGNTIPLLKTTLHSYSMNDIPLKNENIFCFDSESFRYLVVRQNGIRFNDKERSEYKTSWSTSVIESNRLIDYIRNNLRVCRSQSKWQSIKHAQLEIIHMIRPMLETVRNILRNKIIKNMDSATRSIELLPRTIHRAATLCLSCECYPIQIDHFWIVRDIPHEIQETCQTCSCASDQHISIDYVLDYELMNCSFNYNQYQIKDMLTRLSNASTEFAYFLMHAARSSKDDPFYIALMRMISEETNLCLNQKPNHLNLQLINDLTMFKHEYEERITKMRRTHQFSTLPDIYRCIHTIYEYPMAREQMIAVKQGQEMIMKQHDYQVD